MAISENKPLIIIGGAGHGCIIEACVNDNRNRYHDYEWEIKGFCNDYDDYVDGYPVLGKLNDLPRLVEEGYYFSWGIHLIKQNDITAKLFDQINIPDERWATIIHKSAFVDKSVELEPGVFIMYNAYIAPRTHIGKCTMIKANTNIGHDVIIGALAHVAMGATVVSCSSIGFCADIAVNSTMLAHTSIGDYSMLGAHSLLTHNIPSGEVWAGNPAKQLNNSKIMNKNTIGGGKYLTLCMMPLSIVRLTA